MSEPTTPGAPPAPDAGPQVSGDFTPDQLAQMAQWAVEDGSMTREQADTALKSDGVQPQPAPSEIDAHLTEIGFAPAKPEEFRLPPMLGEDGRMTPELAAVDKAARGWLSAGRFDAAIGNALAAEANRVGERWQAMNDAQRELYQRTERAKLDRLWGQDAEKNLKLARQLVQEIEAKAPGIVAFLVETGAGNSSFVIANLYTHATRLSARHG